MWSEALATALLRLDALLLIMISLGGGRLAFFFSVAVVLVPDLVVAAVATTAVDKDVSSTAPAVDVTKTVGVISMGRLEQ